MEQKTFSVTALTIVFGITGVLAKSLFGFDIAVISLLALIIAILTTIEDK